MSKRAVVIFAIVGFVIVAWGVRWLIRARTESAHHSCITALKTIDGAKQTWALQFHKTTNDVPTWNDLTGGSSPILGWRPGCPEGGIYTMGRVGEYPTCSLGGPTHTLR